MSWLPFRVQKSNIGNWINCTGRIDLFIVYSPCHCRDLGENNISALPPRLFRSQQHLEQLFLCRNRLETIPSGIFSGLVALQWLFMQENLLHTFPLIELTGLIALEWFNLSNNQLRLDGEHFPILPHITEMYVKCKWRRDDAWRSRVAFNPHTCHLRIN